MKPIEVVPYNPMWPQQFEQEAKLIKQALGDACVAVHHVGSTSVPHLPAKPKIDIIVVVKCHPAETVDKLKAVGFEYRGEYNIPLHFGFSKRGRVEVNLHLYRQGHPEIELNLMFRDYLRSHPEVRDEYGAWKLKLVQDPSSFEKNNAIFTGYNLGKDALIRKILKLAGFQSLRFLRCTHYEEWDAAKRMRQKYFFDRIPIQDPYTWTFNHPDHAHFVLCLGVEVIGYAHIQLWPESRAALRMIVVEEDKRHRGFGRQFLEWIQTWASWQGIRSLHTEARPDAVAFYQYMGYVEAPFNDPEGQLTHPLDLPMAIFLN
jgi:GrpB-like predicted nucleotidyltransferase (UPF0157 family)/GNAT superfamily N-acetyltransferase